MSMYRGIIEVGDGGVPTPPILVLSSRGGNKIGAIRNVTGIEQTHPLSDVAELSFDVTKGTGKNEYSDWDKLKDFKLIQIPRENTWYEAKVTVDEEDDLVKHVTCTHANEAELGQLNLYEVEINTEADIERDDYKETFFYDEDDPSASLLHRILKDKAPHYQIYHVDTTLTRLFRQFSFNGTSIQDALNEIAEECNCLFVYGEWFENDYKYHRTISAYDLEDYCYHCGKRGNYTDGVCTNCGSDNIHYGYGEDTGIFVSVENLANSITYETNTDEVKNCFRLTAGDDIMTSAIKSCNPNMSSYIWYFSEDMLEDMSAELAEKITQYNELVDRYRTSENINISSSLIGEYNDLVNTYSAYNDDLVEIEYPIVGTLDLIKAYYNALALYGFLKSELSPATESVELTTADEQLEILQTDDNMARVGIGSVSGTIAYTTANSAIASYAKVYIDTSRYKVNVFTTDIQGTTWTGTITITSYTDNEDTATDTFEITLFDSSNNENYVDWIEQCVQKAMANREATDLSITNLFDRDESVSDFADRLELYSLETLTLINSLATSGITIMVEQGVPDNKNILSDVYTQLYEPYLNKNRAVEAEIAIREQQLSYLLQPVDDDGNTDPRYPSFGLIDEIENKQKEIADLLNIQAYLGDELWEELSFYRREDEYNNQNYISDGLTDGEIVEYAERFYEDAQKEIVKSATLQHSISAPLKDFLIMEEFYPLQSKFKVGNWIRLKVDGKVYKLRLANWTVDYNSIEDLDVEFTDVVRIGDIMSDTQSILSKSRSMATTYDYTAKQANKGKDASETLKVYRDAGIDFSKIKAIVSRGNTNIVYDDNGILLKRVDGVEILPEQARIYNNGIYITKDAWETVSTGLGHYSYVDPETGDTVETYGIIADTVIGRLILGNGLKIYSESSKLTMGDDGLVITADGNLSADNTDLFAIQKQVGTGSEAVVTKYIYVDADGNVKINGNTMIIGGDNTAYPVDDARKYARNYIAMDSSGLMVADLTGDNPPAPSTIQSGKNVLITGNDVKIRDGQSQLASYGDTVVIGRIDGADRNNIRITNDSFSGNKYAVLDTSPDITMGTVETFKIFSGKSEIYEDESNSAYKASGADSVTCQFVCSNIPNDEESIGAFGEIYLLNGTKITSSSIVFVYHYIDQESDDEYIEEPATEYISWYDLDEGGRQELAVDFSYVNNSNGATITVTVDDASCSGNAKVDYIKVVARYTHGEIKYPHYRFGVHNTYSGSSKIYKEGKFSFDIGEDNDTSGNYSFAQGINNEVIGECSSVNGKDNVVTGNYSSIDGKNNKVNGSYSKVVGSGNQANGDYSLVGGVGNVARYNSQTVFGEYAPLTTNDDLLVVGNGQSENSRSYAMRLKSNGRVEFKGAVGSGLAWVSVADMVAKMTTLSLYKPYQFYASSESVNGTDVFWSSAVTAGLTTPVDKDAFGTICRMNANVWHMFFMCNENMYKSKYNAETGVFTTTLIG